MDSISDFYVVIMIEKGINIFSLEKTCDTIKI